MKKLKQLLSLIVIVVLINQSFLFPSSCLAPVGAGEVGIGLLARALPEHFNIFSIYHHTVVETDPVLIMGFNVLWKIVNKAADEVPSEIRKKESNIKIILEFLRKIKAHKKFISFFDEFLHCYSKKADDDENLKRQRKLLHAFLYEPQNIYPVWKTLSVLRSKKNSKKHIEIIRELSGLTAGLISNLLEDEKELKNFLNNPQNIKFLNKELFEIKDYLPLSIFENFCNAILQHVPSDSLNYFRAGVILAGFYTRYVIYDPRQGRRPTFKEAVSIVKKLRKPGLSSGDKKVMDRLEKEIESLRKAYSQIKKDKIRHEKNIGITRFMNSKRELVQIEPEGVWDFVAKGKSSVDIFDMFVKTRKLPETSPTRHGKTKGRRSNSMPKLFLAPMHKISYQAVFTLKTYLEKKMGSSIKVMIPSKLPKMNVGVNKEGVVKYDRMWITQIKRAHSNIVGISIMGRDCIPELLKFLEELEKIDVYIILGGQYITDTLSCTALLKKLKNKEPENLILVRGDGEGPLKELAEIIGGTRPSEGLTEEQIQRIKEMESTGMWAKFGDRFIIKDYERMNLCFDPCLPDPGLAFKTGDDFYDVRIRLTSGCPHACPFCGYLGQKFRSIEIGEFLDWLNQLLQKWDKNRPMHIRIDDDNFLIWRQYVNELKKEMKKSGLLGKVTFSCQASVDSCLKFSNNRVMLDTSYMEVLKELGFTDIQFGADAATNTNIGIHKDPHPSRFYRIKDIIAMTRYLRKLGINVSNNVIQFNPYTSLLEFAKSLMVVASSNIFSTVLTKITAEEHNKDPWFYITPLYIRTYLDTIFGYESVLFGIEFLSEGSIDFYNYSYDKVLAHHAACLKSGILIPEYVEYPEFQVLMEIFRHNPYVWEKLLDELINEDDRELQALGKLAKSFFEYYLSRENKRELFIRSIEKTILSIASFMDKEVSYSAILRNVRKSSLGRVLSKKKEIKPLYSPACMDSIDAVVLRSL